MQIVPQKRNVILEQFTVKAHPAPSFILGEGEEGSQKSEALLFQSTVNVHF